jgi:hypothetical protein
METLTNFYTQSYHFLRIEISRPPRPLILFETYENYVVSADKDASIVSYKFVAVVFGGIIKNQVHVVVAFHQDSPVFSVVFQANSNVTINVFEEKGQGFLARFQAINLPLASKGSLKPKISIFIL